MAGRLLGETDLGVRVRELVAQVVGQLAAEPEQVVAEVVEVAVVERRAEPEKERRLAAGAGSKESEALLTEEVGAPNPALEFGGQRRDPGRQRGLVEEEPVGITRLALRLAGWAFV